MRHTTIWWDNFDTNLFPKQNNKAIYEDASGQTKDSKRNFCKMKFLLS